MRVPYSWLREIVPTRLSPEEVAVALTEHGVEVESVLRPWEALTGVVVARVLEVTDHPRADRLSLATVDAGGEERRLVVGVRNMGPGDLVPYAPPGATLPGLDRPLERRTIRGETSDGMLCSPKELGISADHSGILILPEGESGQDVAGLFDLDDAVIDIEVFPNRPDLLSVLGVAREVAAITGDELRVPTASVLEADEKGAAVASVQVDDPKRCPRYLARVIRGVAIAPSPLRAQIRLTACGMRPVSNVVDATNYALLELGHPMHPFDLRTLSGGAILVRRATEGERLVTLDGVERAFTSEDLMIADPERAVAVAGVMGGDATEVGDATTDVLLESAYFDPLGVLRTARRLGVRTEASIRFERGADPEAVADAALHAAGLIAAWAGGAVLSGEIDVGRPPPRRRVAVRPSRASMLLGMEVSAADVLDVMGRLGIDGEEREGSVEIEVPGRRVDLEIEADLIEEVGRVRGYDALPSTLPGVAQAGGLDPEQRALRRTEDALVRAGLMQIHSVSFASGEDLELFEDERAAGVRVANPVSEEQRFLRSSLLPGLLRAAALSIGHRRAAVRLFERGHVMRLEEEVVEEDAVAALLTGPALEVWPGERRPQDVLDAKGAMEHLLEELGVDGWSLGDPPGPPYHPGRSARVLLNGEPIGELGELHPSVGEGFDVPGRVAVFELRAAPLVAAGAGLVELRPVSRFPPIRRDLAFVVDRSVAAADVRASLVDAAGPLLDRVLLFDVYDGEPLPEGKRSLAFAVDLRAADRTLTDDEAEEVVAAIEARLASGFGAELRAG
ncbi:MAG TPA: phenylalanine--tRNA ligase subunit beta [Actinomycetota bacterium]